MKLQKQNAQLKVPRKLIFIFHGTSQQEQEAFLRLEERLKFELEDSKQLQLHFNNLSDDNQKLLTKIEGLQYNLDEVDKNITTEGLLNIIPSSKNSDPLTPLDQKFVTLQDLSDHYKLFVNRVQQQLSVLGGGGAVRIEDLEDVDISSAMVDGKVLEYDSSTGKWKGGTGGGGDGSNRPNQVGFPGVANTGGGGGATGTGVNPVGYSGGPGICVIRYVL